MESNEPPSLDWKTCFKKILAPHLLNTCEEKNDAPHLLNPPEEKNYTPHPMNPPNNQQPNDACQNIVNPKNDIVSTTAFLNNPEKLENDINYSFSEEYARNGISAQSFIFDFDDSDLADANAIMAKNRFETEENVANIIAADAEELAKKFKALKVKKKDRYFSKMAKSSRNAPDWNIAFKKVLDPKYAPESSLKTSEELVDKAYSSHPEFHDSCETNPWAFHRICKKDEHLSSKKQQRRKVPASSSSAKCNKKRRYSKEEMEVLGIFKQVGTFKRPEEPHLNTFDGAGVNYFKDSDVKSSTKNRSSYAKKPKNVSPPGGWVCAKPLTIEEVRKKPPTTQCWDWEEESYLW